MATWTTIADARLEPDKPARSIDALALRDNPIAIAENAANAPKVEQYYALITTSTTWTVPKTGQYWIDLIGGGGGGGFGGGTGGGGGGSGYVASKMLTLTHGDTYPIVIGIAGNGGVGGAPGLGGTATTGFGLSAAGGLGGAFAGAGGAGHSSGRNGSAGSGATAGGKGGSAPLLVPDINATDGAGASGSGGFGYGAGGGGGSANVGGAGAQGAVIIRGI